jgi:4-amino-4-deoxy-L-arabinose transferase-like glycosyltransferase
MRSIDAPSLAVLSKPSMAFALLTVFYIAFMFLPRLTPMGMFGDGLLYASLSRNLAAGTGSWWAPYFSSGYWLTEVAPDAYWENPPLMFWVQSVFFSAMGDHWWIEKLYSLVLLTINCLLIAKVWSLLWRRPMTQGSSLAWMPVWFFYLIPIVVWGSPQNLIDSQLLTFCLLALWCLLKALTAKRHWLLLMALTIMCLFAGVLTKGPVALYPVIVPALYAIILERSFINKGIALSVLLFAGVVMLFLVLILWHEPARFFFTQYWEQRLSVAIEGGRADGLRTGWERFYIFWLLLRENSMILPVSLVLFFVAWRKNLVTSSFNYERRAALFFFVLAFCATVPVMASTRQAGMYLIPGLVLFAMAAGYLHAPLFMHWFTRITPKASRIISGLALSAL